MRNEKGITLVALIGIMVLLIILAGVSISLVLNDKPEEVPVTNTVTEAPVDVEEDSEPVVEEDDEEVTNTVEDDEEPVVDDEEVVEDEEYQRLLNKCSLRNVIFSAENKTSKKNTLSSKTKPSGNLMLFLIINSLLYNLLQGVTVILKTKSLTSFQLKILSPT